jgi:hypothetical protein
MSDDAVQLEILEAEKVIRRLAIKLQDVASTAETLALSQQAYSEAGDALRNVATLLSKTHDLISDQSKELVGDIKSFTTSIVKVPHSILSKLDLLEAGISKDVKEVSASIRADIQNRTDAIKQATISSDLATATGFESAALSLRQLEKVVCTRAQETQGFLRKIANSGSYFLWVIVIINGLIALGVAAILVRLFGH